MAEHDAKLSLTLKSFGIETMWEFLKSKAEKGTLTVGQDSCKELHQKQTMNFILKDGQNFDKEGERVEDTPRRTSNKQKATRLPSAVCVCVCVCARARARHRVGRGGQVMLACKVTGEISLLVYRVTRPHRRVCITSKSYILHKRQQTRRI